MMIDEARRVSDLLVTLDDAREWRETFEGEKVEFIGFERTVAADNIRLEGSREEWSSELRMHRTTAIDMMAWLEQRTLSNLECLGVTAPSGSPTSMANDREEAVDVEQGRAAI